MNVMDFFSLQGKVAVVTGGAAAYGKQIGMALSQAGAKTYVSSRNEHHLKKIMEDYRREGCEVQALQLDQDEESSVERFKERIMSDNGRVDVLVNNATRRDGAMADWNDTEGFLRSMRTNAVGLYLVTLAFGEIMKEQRSGSIINIGSIQGSIGPDRSLYEGLGMGTGQIVTDYYYHKGGMVNFTRCVASHYGPYHIRCNCVSPGGLLSDKVSEEFVKRYGERTFLGRMANDTDLMGAIIYLASDAAAYVTGVNLFVDGGYTAK